MPKVVKKKVTTRSTSPTKARRPKPRMEGGVTDKQRIAAKDKGEGLPRPRQIQPSSEGSESKEEEEEEEEEAANPDKVNVILPLEGDGSQSKDGRGFFQNGKPRGRLPALPDEGEMNGVETLRSPESIEALATQPESSFRKFDETIYGPPARTRSPSPEMLPIEENYVGEEALTDKGPLHNGVSSLPQQGPITPTMNMSDDTASAFVDKDSSPLRAGLNQIPIVPQNPIQASTPISNPDEGEFQGMKTQRSSSPNGTRPLDVIKENYVGEEALTDKGPLHNGVSSLPQQGPITPTMNMSDDTANAFVDKESSPLRAGLNQIPIVPPKIHQEPAPPKQQSTEEPAPPKQQSTEEPLPEKDPQETMTVGTMKEFLMSRVLRTEGTGIEAKDLYVTAKQLNAGNTYFAKRAEILNPENQHLNVIIVHLEKLYNYMRDNGYTAVYPDTTPIESLPEHSINLTNLINGFLVTLYGANYEDKLADPIHESDVGKNIALAFKYFKPSEIAARLSEQEIGTGTLDKIAKLINGPRVKYITEMYRDGETTYNRAQSGLEKPLMDQEQFDTATKLLAKDIISLVMLYPEGSDRNNILTNVLPALFEASDMSKTDKEAAMTEFLNLIQLKGTGNTTAKIGGSDTDTNLLPFAEEIIRPVIKKIVKEEMIENLKQSGYYDEIVRNIMETSQQSFSHIIPEAAGNTGKNANVNGDDGDDGDEGDENGPEEPETVNNQNDSGADAERVAAAVVTEALRQSVAPTAGGGQDMPSTAIPDPLVRVKELQKKLKDVNTKWRDLKAGFDEVGASMTSFYKWLYNSDENSYDAFKTTYTDSWIGKITGFEKRSRDDLDAIRAVLEGLMEKEGGLSDELRHSIGNSINAALDDEVNVKPDAEVKVPDSGDVNLAALYKQFINKASNLYNQTKAFIQKFETVVKNNNELQKQQRQQPTGYGMGGPPVMIAPLQIPEVNYIKPLDLIASFKEIIETGKNDVLKSAEDNVKQAVAAVTKLKNQIKDTKEATQKAGLEKQLEKAQLAQDAAEKAKNDIPASQNVTSIMSFIKARQQKLDAVFAKLALEFKKQSSPALALTANDNMFAKILNEYLTKKSLAPDAEFLEREKLVESLHANQLVPKDVLKVNRMDKVVFVFLTLFMRLFCLTVIESMVERGYIKTITAATFGLFGLYTLIFIAFTMMVNIDLYRLRIVFNMLNMHANGGYVYMHLGLLWLFGCFIYLVLSNMNVFSTGMKVTAISEYEKQVLISKIELLSLIVWALLTIVIVLM